MSEVKFSCPKCGQHLAGDETWAGRQIQCPACQFPFTVPMAPRPLGIAGNQASAPPPPPPPPAAMAVGGIPVATPVAAVPAAAPVAAIRATRYQPRLPGQFPPREPFSLLAFFSFLMACFGFLWLPALVCGHIALVQIKRRPVLRGRGFAVAGLILGYIAMALTLLMLVAFLAGMKAARSAASGQRSAPAYTPGDNGQFVRRSPSPAAGRGGATGPVSRVMTDPSTVSIASAPVSGQINSTPFRMAGARLQNGVLTLEQGTDSQVLIFLFPKEGETFSGKTILVPNAGQRINPHIHARSRQSGGGSDTQLLTDGYAMRLEFGQQQGSTISGKIYLELPIEKHTRVSGTFQANLK